MRRSSSKQTQQKAGALVPVAAGGDGLRTTRQADMECASPRAVTALYAASPSFLAQLSCQYETRSQASKRRAEARATAEQRYTQSTDPKRLRHLVFA